VNVNEDAIKEIIKKLKSYHAI